MRHSRRRSGSGFKTRSESLKGKLRLLLSSARRGLHRAPALLLSTRHRPRPRWCARWRSEIAAARTHLGRSLARATWSSVRRNARAHEILARWGVAFTVANTRPHRGRARQRPISSKSRGYSQAARVSRSNWHARASAQWRGRGSQRTADVRAGRCAGSFRIDADAAELRHLACSRKMRTSCSPLSAANRRARSSRPFWCRDLTAARWRARAASRCWPRRIDRGAQRPGGERCAQRFDTDRPASTGARLHCCAHIWRRHFRCGSRRRGRRCAACFWRNPELARILVDLFWRAAGSRARIRDRRADRRAAQGRLSGNARRGGQYRRRSHAARAVARDGRGDGADQLFSPAAQPIRTSRSSSRAQKSSVCPTPRRCTKSTSTARGWRDAICAPGRVARGGIRFSDRPDDFRTEILT